jgi:hypothetical protein
MPTGQGALAQQTPQPLQRSPTAGLTGASACSQMIDEGIVRILCMAVADQPAVKCAPFAAQFMSVAVQVGVLKSPPMTP